MNSLLPELSRSRRRFLLRATGAAGALALSSSSARAFDGWLAHQQIAPEGDRRSDREVAEDESYWARVRRAYALHPGVINLDHGWTNPAPRDAMESLVGHARALEALPAEMLPQMWETVSTTELRAALAGVMRVAPEEIALVRNATEALDTVLLGLPMRAGDEIVCSRHDYYAMLDALDQRRARDGVVLRLVEPPVPAPSMEGLEQMYAAALGPRTRLVLLTHPSNLTGQLLPVRKIADGARAVGAQTIVDGAQSLGLLDDPVRALGCDYYGASAHKWLGTPVGLGVLWMRPELAGTVWPLVPAPIGQKGMSRFEWIGTGPEYINAASIPAIQLHNAIGASRKAARLRHLSAVVRATIRRVAPDARFYADDAPEMTCGLTVVEIPSVDVSALQQRLRHGHGILTQAMTGIRHAPAIRGLRVSPNVYTSPAELHRFEKALATELPALRGKRG